ncbi:MAG: hypothetical protein ACP5D7_19820 [Limnospira sp.]
MVRTVYNNTFQADNLGWEEVADCTKRTAKGDRSDELIALGRAILNWVEIVQERDRKTISSQ